MEQQVKRILLLPTFLLTSFAIFANPLPIHKTVIAGRNAIDTVVNNKSLSAKTILTEKLVSFNATYFRNSVNLHWNINAVNYVSHFDIERSIDGTNFEKVGEATRTANSSNDYSFEDNFKASVAKKNDLYYRLRQTDADSKAVYSKVLILRSYNSKSVEAISVTPDPSVNDIEVNVQLKQSSYVVIKVTDKNGNEVMRKSTGAETGDNKFALAGTSKLQAGTYMLEIIVNSNERMNLQLIKS